MIISHIHKFVFVAIPKTGTHAIRRALRPELGKFDWEQCTLFEDKRFPINQLAQISHGHFTCKQVEPYFPKGTWSKYLKFCFVRNPYDRFVSFCNFYYPKLMKVDPEKTMMAIFHEHENLLNHHILLKPQHEFVYDENLKSCVDFIGKYEYLANDFKQVCNQLDIQYNALNQVNGSRGNKKVVNEELATYIYDHYKLDFELFKYSKLYTTWQR